MVYGLKEKNHMKNVDNAVLYEYIFHYDYYFSQSHTPRGTQVEPHMSVRTTP